MLSSVGNLHVPLNEKKCLQKKEQTSYIDDILLVRRRALQKTAFFCLPQVLRSMTRSAGDEKFKVRALLACVAGAGFFLGRRKKSRGRATPARAL